jgi:two-component system OmpR family sensor kinase
VVGVSLAPYERTQLLAAIGTLLLCVLVVAAGAFLTRRAVGTALRPLPTWPHRRPIGADTTLDRRFGLGSPRDELTAPAATLDGLLRGSRRRYGAQGRGPAGRIARRIEPRSLR